MLVTERDLAAGPPAEPGRGMLAMGAPDYERAEEGIGTREASLASASEAGAGAVHGPAPYRGRGSSCEEFARLEFQPLPSTALELRSIQAVWTARGGTARPGVSGDAAEPAWSLSGAEATEGAFKRFAPGRRVVHLATHGFFIGDRCGRAGRGAGSPAPGAIASNVESPLLRSGLALAGANRRGDAPGTPHAGEDGVLTAEEAAALDLSGVEWVVLSACDTGRGEARAHEGVLGLRRALQISGARTIVMSLWAVDDRSTAEWMRELYRNRFARSESTMDAVRTAQRSVLRDRRARGLSDHPFHWAAFVAAGDWR
jgi:hypothetical protein